MSLSTPPVNHHLNVSCASLSESLRLWPCSEHRLVIYTVLDPVLYVQHLLEQTGDHGMDTLPGEVAEVMLAQLFSKTLNGG